MSFLSLFRTKETKKQQTEIKSTAPLTETKEFFKNFLNYKKILSIEISNFKLINYHSNQYAVYVITITTTDLQYKIEKRYREFLKMYQQIKNTYTTLHFGDFPKKKFFRNLREILLEDRRKKLETFLRILLQICNYLPIYDFLNFIRIKEVYEQNQINFDYCNFSYIKEHLTSIQDQELIDFLIKLNLEPTNLIKNFQELETFILSNKTEFSSSAIEILYDGDLKLKGLFELCGTLSSDHVVCTIGMKCLSNIMNYELNQNSEEFINEFVKFHPRHIAKLNLKDHIATHPAKNCKRFALSILQKYLNEQTSTNRYCVKSLLETEGAMKEYEQWEYSKSIISLKTESIEKNSLNWFNNCSLSEGLRINSATYPKKSRSPLMKRKNLKEPKSSCFKTS